MGIHVREFSPDYDFEITTASYVGQPVDNTVVFITRKAEKLLGNLQSARNCLVFAEEGIAVPAEMMEHNCFVFKKNPQWDYAQFVERLYEERMARDAQRKYTLTEGGYYLGENVSIGEGARIYPGCFIGHDVVIGKRATIKSGVRIERSVIGDDFFACENSVIGADGFANVRDDDNNKRHVPCLGRVLIGDHVYVGAQAMIEVGNGGDTVLEDYVKLDVFVCVGHDSRLGRNVEIPAAAVVAGFVDVGERAYIGLGATLRNRITIGANTIVGMGAVVTKSVPDNTTVIGNPARPMNRD